MHKLPVAGWYFIKVVLLQAVHVAFGLIKVVKTGGWEFYSDRVKSWLMTAKNFLFCSLLFPNTVFISTLFWLVFNINRELAYPAEFDKYVSPWQNHVVHTLIVLPVIAEVHHEGRSINLPEWKKAFAALNLFAVAYNAVYVLNNFKTLLEQYKDIGCYYI